MKRIVITGVAGLIGSHLADALLLRGYHVIGIDNLRIGKIINIKHNLKHKKFKFIQTDILNFTELKNTLRDADVVVHLAALKKISEEGSAFDTLRVNTEGTYNVFEAVKKKRIKVMFASTSDVYGMSREIPFKENGNLLIGPPTAKRWAYAVSKIYGEQLAFAYYKEFKVPMVILRYFGCFGSRSSFTWSGGHIPLFIDAVLNDKEAIIHGDGSQTRSMGYVDDSVRGTILAMENPRAVSEIFNIGCDEEMSVIESVRLIHKIADTGKKLKLKFIPHRSIFGEYKDIARRVPDLSKAKRILGYVPEVSLEEAIRKTIALKKEQIL